MNNIMIFFAIIISINYISFSQNPEWLTYNQFNPGLNEKTVKSLAIDSTGNKWFGDNISRVHKFDDAIWFNFDIPGNVGEVYDIQVDSDQNIWVCHIDGISKFNGKEWTHFTPYNSKLPTSEIFSITFDSIGNKWIGSQGFRLLKFDDKDWKIFKNEMIPSLGIFTIAIDDQSRFWCGGNYISHEPYGVVSVFDSINWKNYLPGYEIPYSEGITSIVIDKQQIKWIGSVISQNVSPEYGGLLKYDDTTWTVFNKSNSGLPDNSVDAIAIDDKNVKWLGTRGGLAKFDDTSWTVWNTANSDIPSNRILCIVIDKYGNKWLGTDNGLAVFREGGVVGVEVPKDNTGTSLCCYPNPVNETATINYQLIKSTHVIIKILDVLGNTVSVLIDEYKENGSHNIIVDVSRFSQGFYYYQLITDDEIITGKMILIK